MTTHECGYCYGPVRHCSWCGAHVPRAQLVDGRCSLRCERAYRLSEIDRGPLRSALDEAERRLAAARDAKLWFGGAATAAESRDLDAAIRAATNERDAAAEAYRDAKNALR
jgi:hypothetical protein